MSTHIFLFIVRRVPRQYIFVSFAVSTDCLVPLPRFHHQTERKFYHLFYIVCYPMSRGWTWNNWCRFFPNWSLLLGLVYENNRWGWERLFGGGTGQMGKNGKANAVLHHFPIFNPPAKPDGVQGSLPGKRGKSSSLIPCTRTISFATQHPPIPKSIMKFLYRIFSAYNFSPRLQVQMAIFYLNFSIFRMLPWRHTFCNKSCFLLTINDVRLW